MNSSNFVVIRGNLCFDPSVKVLPSGVAVANLTVASNRTYTAKNGEEKKKTAFVDCVAWDSAAEYIGANFAKGDLIFIEGELETRIWERESGKQKITEIRINSFSKLENPHKNGNGNSSGNGKKESEKTESNSDDVDGNDVPF